jgi:hypothetical protein
LFLERYLILAQVVLQPIPAFHRATSFPFLLNYPGVMSISTMLASNRA